MARTPPPTEGERIRAAAEQMLDVADRWDTPSACTTARQRLRDELEQALDDGRTVIRGRGFR